MAKPLTAKQVQTVKGPKMICDGGGLYLRVTPTQTRSWIFRWRDRTTGKLRDMGLGPVADYPLAMARTMATERRRLVREGLDPVRERERERTARRAEAGVMLFREAAETYVKTKIAPEIASEKNLNQWYSSLRMYAYPALGDLDVGHIEVPHVMQVLTPIWSEKTETANRVRARVEAVLNWCGVQGYRDMNKKNPATWRGTLSHLLPAPNKIKTRVHHAALPYSQVPKFYKRLSAKGGTGARALQFAILCASRSGEVRGATWEEIDLSKKTWTISPERMKSKRGHTVPLSVPAIKLLQSLPRDSELVFPAVRGGMLSDMTLLKVCRDFEAEAVPHGFRSSFKDYCREKLPRYPDELSELALAHVNSDATRAAYARSDLLESRRKLMQDWARYVTNPTT